MEKIIAREPYSVDYPEFSWRYVTADQAEGLAHSLILLTPYIICDVFSIGPYKLHGNLAEIRIYHF